jgi:hypothetical protein
MCVFKYHAFIYFLRPPPWYGTFTIGNFVALPFNPFSYHFPFDHLSSSIQISYHVPSYYLPLYRRLFFHHHPSFHVPPNTFHPTRFHFNHFRLINLWMSKSNRPFKWTINIIQGRVIFRIYFNFALRRSHVQYIIFACHVSRAGGAAAAELHVLDPGHHLPTRPVGQRQHRLQAQDNRHLLSD